MINNDNIRLPDIRILSNQGETMKIKELDINGIGGIKELHLSFNERFNAICGSNGVGKTTILNIIVNSFVYDKNLKKNANVVYGNYRLLIDTSDNIEELKVEKVGVFDPNEILYSQYIKDFSNYIMMFGLDRNIDYTPLKHLDRDPDQTSITGSNILAGVKALDIKNWFANRFLFSTIKDSLPPSQLSNNKLAQKLFSVLDPSINFKTVIAKSYDIMLSTSNGDLYFEYLSSGYKSCIYIIMGIIKEIEYRFDENHCQIENFDGVILIDEIDLHLHPTWQAQLIHALKEIFPVAQFIVTTHSPSVLQSLRKEEIIALTKNDVGDTIVKELNIGEYGLQGWSLEEILRDVMEMTNTSSNFYKETLDRYDQAMNEDNGEEVLKQYHILMEMLHPANPLRKLLGLQVAEWEE